MWFGLLTIAALMCSAFARYTQDPWQWRIERLSNGRIRYWAHDPRPRAPCGKLLYR
ncbi:unnamed protein product [Cylicocyclus nassatus]|uniref:Uncharacterized protein n=1 Tax=Cylicocyclus nassatus TaxID=53992 RepID=A0AA36DL34_CYLNA|nr:unnamed protein product [Cylicocyclus nassatus]